MPRQEANMKHKVKDRNRQKKEKNCNTQRLDDRSVQIIYKWDYNFYFAFLSRIVVRPHIFFASSRKNKRFIGEEFKTPPCLLPYIVWCSMSN